MKAVAELAKGCGAGLAKRLAVSVPSHCPLLGCAGENPGRSLRQRAAENTERLVI